MRTWLVAALCVLALTGCSSEPPPAPAPEAHTDTKTVADLFPWMSGIVEASWLEETRGGDSRAPGPSDRTFHTLFRVDDAGIKQLNQFTWEPAAPDWATHLHPKLANKVDSAQAWMRSAAFDELSTSKYHGSFHVLPAKGLVYFSGQTT